MPYRRYPRRSQQVRQSEHSRSAFNGGLGGASSVPQPVRHRDKDRQRTRTTVRQSKCIDYLDYFGVGGGYSTLAVPACDPANRCLTLRYVPVVESLVVWKVLGTGLKAAVDESYWTYVPLDPKVCEGNRIDLQDPDTTVAYYVQYTFCSEDQSECVIGQPVEPPDVDQQTPPAALTWQDLERMGTLLTFSQITVAAPSVDSRGCTLFTGKVDGPGFHPSPPASNGNVQVTPFVSVYWDTDTGWSAYPTGGSNWAPTAVYVWGDEFSLDIPSGDFIALSGFGNGGHVSGTLLGNGGASPSSPQVGWINSFGVSVNFGWTMYSGSGPPTPCVGTGLGTGVIRVLYTASRL